MKRVAVLCLLLSVCILSSSVSNPAAAVVTSVPDSSPEQRLVQPVIEREGDWEVGVGDEEMTIAAGTTRKSGGRTKSRREPASAAPQKARMDSPYTSWDIDSLLQALQPMKDVRKGRLNAGNPKGVSLSSKKTSDRTGPNGRLFRLGLEWSARNEYDNAIAAFTAAIGADPRDDSSYYNRAVIRQKCGQFEAAIDDYTRAVRLAPNDAAAYYNRGMAYQCSGNVRAAIEDYGRAIRLNPGDPGALWNRGIAFSRQGREDLASADYCRSRDAILEERESEKRREKNAATLQLAKAAELAEREAKQTRKQASAPKDEEIAKSPDVPKTPEPAKPAMTPGPPNNAKPGEAPKQQSAPKPPEAPKPPTATKADAPKPPDVPKSAAAALAPKAAEAAGSTGAQKPVEAAKATQPPKTAENAKPTNGTVVRGVPADSSPASGSTPPVPVTPPRPVTR